MQKLLDDFLPIVLVLIPVYTGTCSLSILYKDCTYLAPNAGKFTGVERAIVVDIALTVSRSSGQ